MCGIAGLWSTEAIDPATLERLGRTMTGVLAHRGPDDNDVFVQADQGLCLGHVRLSILDLSPTGHQPMRSHSGRWEIVFNGEIYNHPELRRELAGRPWRGHSDTEVLLEAIETLGPAGALERATGMFAFAAWDRAQRQLWLGRDRVGEKPLYYGRIGSRLVFASELKAIVAVAGGQLEVDHDAVVDLLRHSYVPAPRTIYRGLRKLPPGCLVCFDSTTARTGDAVPVPYWNALSRLPAARIRAESWSEKDYLDEVEATLRASVRAQMMADVTVGAFLSGGIDSSLVVALMQQQSAQPVQTFTIGFEVPEMNEAPWAAKVAQHLGTAHTELMVSDAQARAVVPTLAGIYDEPFADSSQIPTLLVSGLARRHVKVCLSGDGGDELFGGYSRYAIELGRWESMQRLPPAVQRLGAAITLSTPAPLMRLLGRWLGSLRGRQLSRPLDQLIRERARLAMSGSLARQYRASVTYWAEAETLAGRSAPAVDTTAWRAVEKLEATLSPLELFMLADTVTYLPDDILVKVDRASMAHSLELRAPLLDHRLIELAWEAPPALRRDKRVLKSLAFRHIPRVLLERPKVGFGVPLGSWLRGPLRDWADDLLAPAALQREGLVQPGPVVSLWQDHRAGRIDAASRLWIVLMLQQWATEVRRGSGRMGGVGSWS